MIAIIAILVANVQALGFDFKIMSRLLATVDPKTCNCIDEQLCRIEIPYDYTSVLDISCQNSLKVPTKNMYQNKLYFSCRIVISYHYCSTLQKLEVYA